MKLENHHVVIIAGSQRSGTTLVGQILGAHPNAVLIDESNGLYKWTDALFAGAPKADIDEAFENCCRSALTNYQQAAGEARFLDKHSLSEAVTHLVLKAPNLTYSAAAVARTFPNVSVIYMTRDIRDVVASMQRLEHIPMVENQVARLKAEPELRLKFASDLRRLESPDISRTRQMAIIAKIKMALDSTFIEAGLPVHHLRYETLVTGPDESISGLLDHAQLAPSKACARFHKVMRGWGPGLTDRTRPIDTLSQNNWSTRITGSEQAEIWEETKELMLARGYRQNPTVVERPTDSISTRVLESPVIVLGRGGGGTRLLSKMLQDMGVFLGNRLNPSEDSMEWASLVYEMAIKALVRPYPDKSGKSFDWKPVLIKQATEILAAGNWDGEQAWGFKLPELSLVPGSFAKAFPSGKFVHLVRHPVSASLRRLHKTSRIEDPVGRAALRAAYAHSGIPLSRIQSDELYLRNAISWLHQAGTLSDFGRKHLPPERYIEVRFEDLCKHPKATFDRLADFLGTTGAGQFVDPGIDWDRLNRYERTPEQVDEVWDMCRAVAERFGYTHSNSWT